MVASDAVANIGDVNTLSVGEENLSETRFYREVLQPFDIRDIIWFPALRTGSRMASMHASRGDKLSYYDKHEIDVFKLISPHVCRSLAISDALDIRTLNSEMLERTLDKLLAGVFLTARDGQVVYMNATAQRQIKDAKAVRLVNNRLCPVDPVAHAALAKTVAQAASGKYELNLTSHSLAIPDRAGHGYVATFLPMEQSKRREIFAPYTATCAVFMQDPQASPLMPGEAFARLHGLTGAELRVLLSLSQGLGGKESAEILGISEPTVRSHLQRIFSKTGTSRQSSLLQLLHNSTPAVQGHK
jgi:DNA-binding CsgD family transcriptional regulator